MPKPSREEIKRRIQEYRRLAEQTSRALKATEDSDTYLTKLRVEQITCCVYTVGDHSTT